MKATVTNKIEVIVQAAKNSRRGKYLTYKFATMEAARLFIARWGLEDKVVDIL